MSVTAAQLVAEVKTTGVSESKTQLNEMSGAVEKTSGGFKSMLGNALSFVAGQAIFTAAADAVNFLKNQMVDSVKVAIQHQQAMAQTTAVLKSTHDASGETAQSISDLAMSLSQVTPFTEDTTEAAENMLLTFTNIGKNVFPQATKTVLDMSQALGQDTKSSAIQLGKALNDPITGITALQRVGVTFTDSQKKLIQSLVDSGNVAGAQKVILQELQREFGGSAEAAGKTFGGQLQILQNHLEDLKIKIGTAVMPILSNLMGFVSNNILPGLENFGGIVKKVWGYLSSFELGSVVQAFQHLGDAVGKILSPLTSLGSNGAASAFFTNLRNDLSQALVKAIQDVAGFINGLANSLNGLSKNGAVTGFLGALQQGFGQLQKIIGGQLGQDFQTFSKTAQQVGQWFQTSMLPAIQQAMPGFEHLGSVIATTVVPSLAKIWAVGQQVAREVMPPLIQAFEKVAPIVVKVGGFLADNLGKALQFIMPFAVQAAQAIGQFAGEIISRVVPIVQTMWDKISTFLNWIKPYWPQIWGVISTILKSTFDTIKGVIQIAWSIITGIFKVALDLIQGNWSQAWDDVKGTVSGVWDGIKSIFQGVIDIIWKDTLKKAIDVVVGGVEGFVSNLVAKFNDLKSHAIEIFVEIKQHISDALNSLGGIAQGAWNNVTGAVKGGINDVIGAINGFINNLDKVHINMPGGGTIGFNIPDIPYLASGGTIAQGGFAIVGERGPEPVWLPGGAQVFPNSQMGAMGSGVQPIIVQAVLQVDGRMMATGLLPHLTTAIRQATGVHF